MQLTMRSSAVSPLVNTVLAPAAVDFPLVQDECFSILGGMLRLPDLDFSRLSLVRSTTAEQQVKHGNIRLALLFCELDAARQGSQCQCLLET